MALIETRQPRAKEYAEVAGAPPDVVERTVTYVEKPGPAGTFHSEAWDERENVIWWANRKPTERPGRKAWDERENRG